MSFVERKEERKVYFEKFIFGWKLRTCTACSGSGYYDTYPSKKCGWCSGSGKERYKPKPVDSHLTASK